MSIMAAEVKTDLKEDIQEIKIRIQKMDKELAVLKWMVGGIGGTILTLCITILAKLFVG